MSRLRKIIEAAKAGPSVVDRLIMPPDPEPEPEATEPLAEYWDADGQLIAPGERFTEHVLIPLNERERCERHDPPGPHPPSPCDNSYTTCPPQHRQITTIRPDIVKAIIEDGPRKGFAWVQVRRADHIPPALITLKVGCDRAEYRRVDALPVLTYREGAE